jgi:prevent-host-death family protein
MEKVISKSKFKPKALEYFREVERSGKSLIISDRGKPVLKIIPYSLNTISTLNSLRESVVKYEEPLEPLDSGNWEVLK